MRKAFFEEHLPKGIKLYEEKFVPKDGFFLGDEVSLCTFVDLVKALMSYNGLKEKLMLSASKFVSPALFLCLGAGPDIFNFSLPYLKI